MLIWLCLLAVGSGYSKKEAKQNAAKSILKRMNELVPSSPDLSPDRMLNVLDVTSPYTDKLQENAVGQLQELCVTKGIQVPEYKMTKDEGPPHAKLFTIMCKVSELEESGGSIFPWKNYTIPLQLYHKHNHLMSSQ
jgi:RISC-loading complex subunit TARBP2